MTHIHFISYLWKMDNLLPQYPPSSLQILILIDLKLVSSGIK